MPTDGSPAVALGHGIAVAFSPDNRWVLTVTTKSPGQFVLQPTGAGEARTVTHDQIDHLGGRFLPDGKRVVFLGRESGHASRAYLLDLESGTTKPITPEGVAGRALSPDGKYIVVLSKGTWSEMAGRVVGMRLRSRARKPMTLWLRGPVMGNRFTCAALTSCVRAASTCLMAPARSGRYGKALALRIGPGQKTRPFLSSAATANITHTWLTVRWRTYML